MTIGQTHLENYNQASQFLIDNIDACFNMYTEYIESSLGNYYPENKWDTSKYTFCIDVENMLEFIPGSISYEHIINNYKARLHLAKKLDAWLFEFSTKENIGYKITDGKIIFNLIKEIYRL